MFNSTIGAVLRERASLQPNQTAFTFLDYDQDWDGVAESLTWAQLYRRSLNLALEIESRGSTGDRAVILAPQGLDYIVAFLGALEAGLIAVPLSVPTVAITMSASRRCSRCRAAVGHSHDIRCRGERRALCPAVRGHSAPSVVEVDSLDLDSRTGAWRPATRPPGHCVPAVHIRVDPYACRGGGLAQKPVANWEQMVATISRLPRCPRPTVSWLPFYHDMGLMLGVCTGFWVAGHR